MILEVCAGTLLSAQNAQSAGADRIELCRDLSVGGLTPNRETMKNVMEKLKIREEGVAERYLEINGVWEDHIRYGLTTEEWDVRRDELSATWLI